MNKSKENIAKTSKAKEKQAKAKMETKKRVRESETREKTSYLDGEQNLNDSNGTSTPFGGRIFGCIQFECF